MVRKFLKKLNVRSESYQKKQEVSLVITDVILNKIFLNFFSIGCVGGICGLANILGREVCTLVELFKKGDLKAASALQQRLIGPNSCVGIK